MLSSIILINPPGRIFSVSYPMGLEYIAAILNQNNYPVKILDYSKKKYSLGNSAKEIIDAKPDFIGISLYSFNYITTKKMIFDIKKNIPETKIIIGGAHVSSLPKFSLEDTKADFAVVGEGEEVILEIIKRIETRYNYFDDIKGLAFWKDDRPVLTPGINLIDSLDSLPFPMWQFSSLSDYNETPGQIFSKRLPTAPILTSRGCPHQCSFCASRFIHGRDFRRRTAKNVVDEIGHLVNNYGVKEITIFDDTFSEDSSHAVSICKEIISRKIDIVWRTAVGLRLDTLSEELLKLFKRSGCYQLSFGIESFSDNVLHKAKKPISKSRIINKIKMVKGYDIETMGYFILGLPDDTEDSIKETIKFARDSELDFLSFTYAIPLPGTEIFNKYYKFSDLDSINWDNFNFYTNKPFKISNVSLRQLKKFYLVAYFSSYFKFKRLKNLINKLIFIRKTRILKILNFIRSVIKGFLI